jgi:hypothetical protein
MRKNHTTIILFFVFTSLIFAQSDTIVCYNLETKQTTFILPVAYDTSVAFAKTNSFIGSIGNQVSLPLTPPTTNLFSGSSFSQLSPAANFYNTTTYPCRTATNLFFYSGLNKSSCSGMLVASNLVLSAAHCFYNASTKKWAFGTYDLDSVTASPAFDSGIAPYPIIGVKKLYILKKFYSANGWEDIALLELKKPIGEQVGWIGMAFSKNQSYFSSKVFHKFSYPAMPDPVNPQKIYNGDTMYYNYGYINAQLPYLEVNGDGVYGVSGQSGSSLFYTDNADWLSFGVLSFSGQYRHIQISQQSFYLLKNIMENYATVITENKEKNSEFTLFPNPFFSILNVEALAQSNLVIRDVFGKTLRHQNLIAGLNTIPFEEFAAGLYFVELKSSTSSKTIKIVKID